MPTTPTLLAWWRALLVEARKHRCELCHAKPDELCRTTRGHKVGTLRRSEVHAPRWREAVRVLGPYLGAPPPSSTKE